MQISCVTAFKTEQLLLLHGYVRNNEDLKQGLNYTNVKERIFFKQNQDDSARPQMKIKYFDCKNKYYNRKETLP